MIDDFDGKWELRTNTPGGIPIKLFINERGFAKIEIGLGKGKKEYDKREDIKQRDISRKIREDL